MEQKQEGADTFPPDGAGPPPAAAVVITNHTWVTWSAVLICVGVFVGVNLETDKQSWEVLSRFGYFPGARIWEGTWWGTMSSTLVHINVLHAFFNLYWLWLLGRLMEDEIGSWRFLAFYLGASIVSSTSQLAFSDVSGHGASGVVYAIFGFMWRTRVAYPKFQSIMVPQTIKVFFIWLVACFFLTAAKVMNIANAAHLSGLIYGAVMAECFVIRRPRLPYAVGAIVLAAVSLVPIWWAPWSVTWQGVKAYDAMQAGRREEAMERLNTIIEREPEDAWAYENRGRLYRDMGELERAAADSKKVRELSDSNKSRD
jgi:GlpG protein